MELPEAWGSVCECVCVGGGAGPLQLFFCHLKKMQMQMLTFAEVLLGLSPVCTLLVPV